MIVRQSYDEIPPKVEYSLSEKGRSIIPVLDNISKWGEKYFIVEENTDSE